MNNLEKILDNKCKKKNNMHNMNPMMMIKLMVNIQ